MPTIVIGVAGITKKARQDIGFLIVSIGALDRQVHSLFAEWIKLNPLKSKAMEIMERLEHTRALWNEIEELAELLQKDAAGELADSEANRVIAERAIAIAERCQEEHMATLRILRRYLGALKTRTPKKP